MKVLQKGRGKLVGWHDPDDARAWVAAEKSRQLIDKRMTVAEVVDRYIHEGDLIASGGFGHVRVSMAIIYEIIRQQKRDLVMAAKTAVHDCDLLVAAGCIRELEVAYAFGHELRGLSPASRKIIEDGECKVIAEISNAGYQWRFLAGMMGVPFIPTRTMLGTDTLAQSSAIVVEDPFSGKPITLVPAAYPDVAFIHVHRCDRYGNAQIDGTMIEDFELSRCARKLILTTEEVVDDAVIREKPWMTMIPFFLVDAVVEVPYGSHPCEMPAMYDFDEDHIAKWLSISRTKEGIASYFDEYIFGVDGFEDYLERCGGAEKLEYLKRRENLQEPKRAPWRNGR